MKDKSIKREIISIFVLIIISVAAVFLVYELWNKDFSIPLFYEEGGDGIGALYTIKNLADGNGFFDASYINAPHELPQYMQDYLLQAFTIKIMSFFSKNLGVLANSFWVLSYILTAISTYALLRRLNFDNYIAMMGGLIYAFLPYHYFRMSHFWLMTYYMVPLAVWIIIDLLDESLFENEEKDKKLASYIKNKKVIVDLIFAFLIGIQGVYYSMFTILFICFVSIISTVRSHKFKFLLHGFVTIIIIMIPIVTTFLLPVILGDSGLLFSYSEARSIYQMDLFALRPILLILPIPEHRWDAIKNWTSELYTQMGINLENYMVHLGFLMSMGLACSLICLFINLKNGKENLCYKMGKLNLFTIIITVVGGFDLLIGIFISPAIRCFNRISVFIGLFSLIAFCYCVKYAANKIKILNKRFAYMILCFGLAVFGILDQTTSAFADFSKYNIETKLYEDPYIENQSKYLNTKEFVNRIEKRLDMDKAMIFQYPINQGMISQFAQTRFVLMSDKLSWSHSVDQNVHMRWLSLLQNLPLEKVLEIISIYDFSGIVVDQTNYADKQDFTHVINQLQSVLRVEPIIDGYGEVYFYDIREYKEEFMKKAELSEKERRSLVEELDGIVFNKDITVILKDQLHLMEADNGILQFGPYISLEKGNYTIFAIGKNLGDTVVWSTDAFGLVRNELYNIHIAANMINYDVTLQHDQNAVEFLAQGSKEMRLNGYICLKNQNENNVEMPFSDLLLELLFD